VEITQIFRVQAIDYSTEKQELKEYLVYQSNCYAKNWMGKELRILEHVEERYLQQTKRLVTSSPDPNTGRIEAFYEKGHPRQIHTFPFGKK
jgi:hypothetical protein